MSELNNKRLVLASLQFLFD